MHNSILIASAIVAAAVILKLPIQQHGRYQITGSGRRTANGAL